MQLRRKLHTAMSAFIVNTLQKKAAPEMDGLHRKPRLKILLLDKPAGFNLLIIVHDQEILSGCQFCHIEAIGSAAGTY